MENLARITRKDLQFNGIYKITNIINNYFYIGSCSSITFLYERLVHHREDLLKNRHCNNYLQRSFNKYGIENFYFEIIEICKPHECIIREQWWMDKLQPHYNLCKIAGSSFGVKLTQETKDKISIANKKWALTEEGIFWRNETSKRCKGKKLSKETIDKIIKGLTGRKHTNETKAKMSANISKKIKNLDTGEIYGSLKDASEKLNINYTYLSGILKDKTLNIVKKRKSKKNIVNLEWFNG